MSLEEWIQWVKNQRGEYSDHSSLIGDKLTWPTPASAGVTGGIVGLAGGSGNRKKLYRLVGEAVGKQMGGIGLNPNWVEQLMGLPVGWTQL